MELLGTILDKALSEYGLLVGLLLVVNYAQYREKIALVKRNDTLADATLMAVNNATAIMTEIKIRLETRS